VLRSYRILDTPTEPVFDDLVRLAAQVCQTPMALITLIDDRRQWFKAELGLGFRETPLDLSICAKAILQPGLLVVRDTTQDPRFHDNPLVTGEPHLRFYAGALLATPDGLPLGTICVLDRVPRDLTGQQAFALTTLAKQVMAQLELRRALAERDEVLAGTASSGAQHSGDRAGACRGHGAVRCQHQGVQPLVLGEDCCLGQDSCSADGGLLADRPPARDADDRASAVRGEAAAAVQAGGASTGPVG
jgi:hypothetical protein